MRQVSVRELLPVVEKGVGSQIGKIPYQHPTVEFNPGMGEKSFAGGLFCADFKIRIETEAAEQNIAGQGDGEAEKGEGKVSGAFFQEDSKLLRRREGPYLSCPLGSSASLRRAAGFFQDLPVGKNFEVELDQGQPESRPETEPLLRGAEFHDFFKF